MTHFSVIAISIISSVFLVPNILFPPFFSSLPSSRFSTLQLSSLSHSSSSYNLLYLHRSCLSHISFYFISILFLFIFFSMFVLPLCFCTFWVLIFVLLFFLFYNFLIVIAASLYLVVALLVYLNPLFRVNWKVTDSSHTRVSFRRKKTHTPDDCHYTSEEGQRSRVRVLMTTFLPFADKWCQLCQSEGCIHWHWRRDAGTRLWR